MLTKFDPQKKGRFGLRVGQTRTDDKVHNGGWYNFAGEKLGWGDLSDVDFKQIANGLEDKEIFVVLPEQASFWKFVTHYGPVGSLCATKPTEQAPGPEYIAENCSWIIVPGIIYRVSDYEFNYDEKPQERQGDDLIRIVNRARVQEFFKGKWYVGADY